MPKQKKKRGDKMSEILLLKETIYKEEVDMIMEGKSVDEIVSIMEEKAKARKEKEELGRKNLETSKKLKVLDDKIKTAEMLLRSIRPICRI